MNVETMGERADQITLRFLEAEPPPKCELRQVTQAVTSDELHREFSEFWVRLWYRDTRLASRSIHEWSEFVQELPDVPACVKPMAIPMTDIRLWEKAP